MGQYNTHLWFSNFAHSFRVSWYLDEPGDDEITLKPHFQSSDFQPKLVTGFMVQDLPVNLTWWRGTENNIPTTNVSLEQQCSL